MSYLQDITGMLRGNRNLQLLALQAVVTQFCYNMLLVVWQPYMISHGTSFTQLGTIQTVITIFTGLGSLIWGRLSDQYGRKPIHIVSMIARVVAVFFAYSATNWYGFLGFGVFIGLSANWSQTNPVSTTLVSESVKEDKMSTALSIYSSAGTLLAVLASPLGGYLAENQGYYLIFISCIVGELFNAVVAQLFLSETLNTPTNPKTSNPYNMLIPERSLMPFYLSSMLTMFSWRIAFSNLNAILVDSYGITTIQLGLMASAFSLSWGLLQTPIGVFIDRYPKRQFLILSRIGFLLISLGYIFFKSFPVLMLLQIINGLSHGFGIPSLTSMVLTQTDKDQRATVMAKLTTLPQIVSIPAPIIGAYLFELYGFDFIVSIRVVFILASILILSFWIKPSKD